MSASTLPTVLHRAIKAMLDRSQFDGTDYKGFNAADENSANWLLGLDQWGKDQWQQARNLCWKYRKQLDRLGFYYSCQSHLWHERAPQGEQITLNPETHRQVKVAIVARGEKASKLWLIEEKTTLWMNNVALAARFVSEGFKPGRSGREFEVGMAMLSEDRIRSAAAA